MYIASAIGCCISIDKNGDVYAIGTNTDGRLGLPNNTYDIYTLISNISNIIQVACGYNHTLFLNADGRVYGCGSNAYGQLGMIENKCRYTYTYIWYQEYSASSMRK